MYLEEYLKDDEDKELKVAIAKSFQGYYAENSHEDVFEFIMNHQPLIRKTCGISVDTMSAIIRTFASTTGMYKNPDAYHNALTLNDSIALAILIIDNM